MRYEVLRNVINSSTEKIPLKERPRQVWTLMNEEMFIKHGLKHLQTAFLEDQMHDWSWKNGQLRFYAHSGGVGSYCDLVVVY